MNILYVVHDNKKGGAALSFLEMVSHLKGKHNIYVLTPHKTGFIPEQLDKMGIQHWNAHYFWWKIAVPKLFFLRYLKVVLYKILVSWNYIEVKLVTRKLANLNIDLIHSNSSVINFGGLLAREMNISHIWHLREYGEEDFGLRLVPNEKKYKYEMKHLADAYIAISNSIANKFSELIQREKIHQIYNGVSEVFSFDKSDFHMDETKAKFLIAGNYCKEKGQIDVVKAVLELRKRDVDGFILYLAGSGSFDIPKKIVKENNLDKFVSFLGCVDNMVELRKKMDVEIVASKCEAFGRVTIEAMRMSNPVIVTNTGGSSELVIQNKTGFLFDYEDFQQLSNYMEILIKSPKLLKRMGHEAFSFSEGRFTSEENAQRVENLYYKVLSEKYLK